MKHLNVFHSHCRVHIQSCSAEPRQVVLHDDASLVVSLLECLESHLLQGKHTLDNRDYVSWEM